MNLLLVIIYFNFGFLKYNLNFSIFSRYQRECGIRFEFQTLKYLHKNACKFNFKFKFWNSYLFEIIVCQNRCLINLCIRLLYTRVVTGHRADRSWLLVSNRRVRFEALRENLILTCQRRLTRRNPYLSNLWFFILSHPSHRQINFQVTLHLGWISLLALLEIQDFLGLACSLSVHSRFLIERCLRVNGWICTKAI